jgi:hypothetical protein
VIFDQLQESLERHALIAIKLAVRTLNSDLRRSVLTLERAISANAARFRWSDKSGRPYSLGSPRAEHRARFAYRHRSDNRQKQRHEEIMLDPRELDEVAIAVRSAP